MKIWLDDFRFPASIWKDEEWDICTSAEDVIHLLRTKPQEISHISFDHDLGLNKLTGYDLAKYIEELAYSGAIRHFITWDVHSLNPAGSLNIHRAMQSAYNYVMKNMSERK